MKVASLDLGSNSFLLLIAEVSNGKIVKVYHDEQKVTRLAQGVHVSREFHPEALQRARACFSYYQKIIQENNVEKIQAVSTSAARDVKNKEEFFAIGNEFGIPIEIISGPKEAELTYHGTIEDDQSSAAIIDVGGGSTEIIGKEEGAVKGWSLDIGSVRLAEIFNAFDKVNDETLDKIDNYIKTEILKNQEKLPKITEAIAVAGTPTTLACLIQKIQFTKEKIHGFEITSCELTKQRENLANMTLEERKSLTGIHPKRADVLVCGTSILKNICDHFSLQKIKVSCGGVRYGLAKQLSK